MFDLEKYENLVNSGIYGDQKKAVKAAKMLFKEIKGADIHDLYGNVPDFDGSYVWPEDCDFKFLIKSDIIGDIYDEESLKDVITGLTVVRA